MDWFSNLFFGTGIAHSIFVLALAIAVGIFLGAKLKFKGITLGITWILFCAIACSHFGMTLDPLVESFAKDLGLILFVYSIGLQVGPGFFSSFGKGGLRLNMLAASIVVLGCATAYVIHLLSGTDIATMTGVLFGAVTNTPGLGAAQQTYQDLTGVSNPDIASGYAMAYPLHARHPMGVPHQDGQRGRAGYERERGGAAGGALRHAVDQPSDRRSACTRSGTADACDDRRQPCTGCAWK